MKIKPLARKKKDYMLFCKLFYIASPSELVMGRYKAGCNIAPNGTPSKYCRRCKYGLPPIIDEAHEIKDVEIPENSYSSKVVYLCDRRRCSDCSYPECMCTSDIAHAKNFENKGCGIYEEREGGEIETLRRCLKEIKTVTEDIKTNCFDGVCVAEQTRRILDIIKINTGE